MKYQVLNVEKEAVYRRLIHYALVSSSHLSVCTFKNFHLKDLNPSYQEFVQHISRFKVEDCGLFSHPKAYTKGQRFHYYSISSEVMHSVSQIGKIEQWGAPNCPDDISFYINYKPWLYTITHETLVFLETMQINLIGGVLNCGAELLQL